jgi:hypothetical protein
MNNREDEADNARDRIIEQICAKWAKEGPPGGLIYFPEEVLAVIDAIGTPSWRLVRETLARIDKEQLCREVELLFNDPDSFSWPLEDPLRCLVLGVFRQYREFAENYLDDRGDNSLDNKAAHNELSRQFEKVDDDDESDWWKR